MQYNYIYFHNKNFFLEKLKRYNELLYRGYDVKIGKTYNCLYNLKRNLKMLVFLFTKKKQKAVVSENVEEDEVLEENEVVN